MTGVNEDDRRRGIDPSDHVQKNGGVGTKTRNKSNAPFKQVKDRFLEKALGGVVLEKSDWFTHMLQALDGLRDIKHSSRAPL